MITAEQFRFFAEMVRQASGISLTEGKEYLIDSRLNELAKVMGLRDINDLYSKAKASLTPQLKDQIVDAMTTNETYFFRDQHPFDTLKANILPDILKKRPSTNKIRLWSAACSTGQEPYSMSMLLSESFQSILSRVEILATDISKQALEKGTQGRFTQVEVNRGLPITLLIKYFKQNGAFWMINEPPKKLISFKQLNLLSPLSVFGTFDCIFCRYVLIYFEPQTKQQILEKLVKALNPGGYLILGATETPVGLSSEMKRITLGKTTCWQKAE